MGAPEQPSRLHGHWMVKEGLMAPCSQLEVKILSIKGAGKGLGHHGVGAGYELEGRSQSEEPPVREKSSESQKHPTRKLAQE